MVSDLLRSYSLRRRDIIDIEFYRSFVNNNNRWAILFHATN